MQQTLMIMYEVSILYVCNCIGGHFARACIRESRYEDADIYARAHRIYG